MTENEAIAAIMGLPKRMQTKGCLESEIIYENHKGMHTYHQCSCGRGTCRSSRCVQCWREMLEVLPRVKKQRGIIGQKTST